jgi:hypothetical protein
MDKYKLANMPVETSTKLNKQDKGLVVDPTLYKRHVYNLMYLIDTSLEIMYVASLISIFKKFLGDSHWKFNKRILRYIVGGTNYKIWHLTSKYNFLFGYIDSYFIGSIDDQKSTFSMHFILA